MITRYAALPLLMIIFLLSGCGGGSTTPMPDVVPCFDVRATSNMLKIIPTTDLSKLETTFKVESCRGEHEAFQVIPHLLGDTPMIHQFNVLASDLVMGNQVIPNENIQIYVQHYIRIQDPSDFRGNVGWWPDPLVPLTNQFDVSSDFNYPLWVDIDVPRNAAAGIYKGNLTFGSLDGGTVKFEYELEVWDITMPIGMHQKAHYGVDQEDIKAYHNFESWNSDYGKQMAQVYGEFLAERHISCHGLPILRPRAYIKPDNRSYYLDFDEFQKDIDKYLVDYNLSCFMFPIARFDLYPDGFIGRGESIFTDDFNARYVDVQEQVADYLEQQGLLDRSFLFLFDEPETKEHYQYIRDVVDLIKSARIYPDYLLTEQPHMQYPDFGTLLDHVDIFVSNVITFYWAGGEEVARQGAENLEEWVYTNAGVAPFPSVAIDKLGIETRIYHYVAYQHGFKGILYGSVNDWTKVNPWESPKTYGPVMGNGCNSMSYPGTIANQYTGQENFDGPCTSIRLELTRDGIEDAELMWMVSQGEPIEAFWALSPNWEVFTESPDVLLAFRRDLARRIMAQ